MAVEPCRFRTVRFLGGNDSGQPERGWGKMKHRITQDLYAYWQRLRGNRTAPDRSEIEPSDIRHILGDTFILEVVADATDYTYRLAGTRVCAAYGRELKGRNLLSQWTGRDRETLATLLSAVATEGAAAVVGVEAKSAHGRTIGAEILFLPVRQGDHGFNRILGSFTPMEQPYWIGVHPLMVQAIGSLRMIWPNEVPSILRSGAGNDLSSVPTFGEHQPRHPILADAAARRVGHLVVLEGGKS